MIKYNNDWTEKTTARERNIDDISCSSIFSRHFRLLFYISQTTLVYADDKSYWKYASRVRRIGVYRYYLASAFFSPNIQRPLLNCASFQIYIHHVTWVTLALDQRVVIIAGKGRTLESIVVNIIINMDRAARNNKNNIYYFTRSIVQFSCHLCGGYDINL